jgi:hypothetical protein
MNMCPFLTAMFLSLYTNDFVYAAPIYLPVLDPQSVLGFIANQTLFVLFSLLNFVAGSLLNFANYILSDLTIPMTDIYALKLKNIGTELQELNLRKLPKNEESLENQKVFDEEIHKVRSDLERRFIELIKELKLQSEYIDGLQNYTEVICFATVGSDSLGIGLACLLTLTVFAPTVIALVIGYIVETAFVCVQGAIITHTKEKFLKELGNFPWYEMSPKMRKIYLQFLHFWQNSPEIILPIFGVLNMELFTDVMKGSYSLFNFFLNFMKH